MKNFISATTGYAIAFSLLGSIIVFPLTSSAGDFSVEFDWGDLKKCTTGRPNTVSNPLFTLSNVPDGTKFLKFRMRDNNAPGYNHGGGKIEYTGDNVIQPGAFKYKSPCPPRGVHTYVWTVTAQSKKSGGKLGSANASKKYP